MWLKDEEGHLFAEPSDGSDPALKGASHKPLSTGKDMLLIC